MAGARYHGVAEEGVPFHGTAAVIGRRLDLPVVSRTTAEAARHSGRLAGFARFAAFDNRGSNRKTRDGLGREPTGPGLIADIDRPAYLSGRP